MVDYNIEDSRHSLSSPRVYTLDTIPQVVGYWQLPGGVGAANIRFTAFTKPRWFTIKMMWWVFEWKWIEAK